MLFPLYFLVSVIASFGMAVVLTEKRYEFPVRGINYMIRRNILKPLNPLARKFFRSKNVKLQNMLKCCVCTAFWTALLCDLFLSITTGFFMWPLTGFAAAGLAWVVFEFFSILEQNIKSTSSQKENVHSGNVPLLNEDNYAEALEESEKD